MNLRVFYLTRRGISDGYADYRDVDLLGAFSRGQTKTAGRRGASSR